MVVIMVYNVAWEVHVMLLCMQQVVTKLLQGCSNLVTTLLQPVACYKVASCMVAFSKFPNNLSRADAQKL